MVLYKYKYKEWRDKMEIEYLTGLNAIVMKAIWNVEKKQKEVTIQDLIEEVKKNTGKELNAASNRIQRWMKIYFPEYLTVYKRFDTTTGMMILEKTPLPSTVIALGVDNIKCAAKVLAKIGQRHW